MRLTGMRAGHLVAGLAVVALASCATAVPSAGPSATAGVTGVRGQVVIDGGCPVLRADSPCPDRPYTAKITLTRRGQSDAVAATVSDADGRFSIGVPPGDYTLRPANLAGSVLPQASPLDVTVPSGGSTQVTVRFDTGIR